MQEKTVQKVCEKIGIVPLCKNNCKNLFLLQALGFPKVSGAKKTWHALDLRFPPDPRLQASLATTFTERPPPPDYHGVGMACHSLGLSSAPPLQSWTLKSMCGGARSPCRLPHSMTSAKADVIEWGAEAPPNHKISRQRNLESPTSASQTKKFFLTHTHKATQTHIERKRERERERERKKDRRESTERRERGEYREKRERRAQREERERRERTDGERQRT